MIKKILTILIRPQLEYAAMIRLPHVKQHVKKLERVQQLGTRMIPCFKEVPYKETLRRLDLPVLEERARGDMIMCKIVNGMDILDREDLIRMSPNNQQRTSKQNTKGQLYGRCQEV